MGNTIAPGEAAGGKLRRTRQVRLATEAALRHSRLMHTFTALPCPGSDPGPEGSEQVTAIKRWTREALGLGEDAVVTVSEFACSDPGCPVLQSVIAVFEEGRTRRWTLTRPRMAVTKLMVRQTVLTPGV